MKDVVIVSAVRTPTGTSLGGLKEFTAPPLGTMLTREARCGGQASGERRGLPEGQCRFGRLSG